MTASRSRITSGSRSTVNNNVKKRFKKKKPPSTRHSAHGVRVYGLAQRDGNSTRADSRSPPAAARVRKERGTAATSRPGHETNTKTAHDHVNTRVGRVTSIRIYGAGTV